MQRQSQQAGKQTKTWGENKYYNCPMFTTVNSKKKKKNDIIATVNSKKEETDIIATGINQLLTL